MSMFAETESCAMAVSRVIHCRSHRFWSSSTCRACSHVGCVFHITGNLQHGWLAQRACNRMSRYGPPSLQLTVVSRLN